MAKKFCEIEEVELEGDSGKMIPSVKATCIDCGAETESFGQKEGSIRRCMVLMKEVCSCSDAKYGFFTCEELDDGEDR